MRNDVGMEEDGLKLYASGAGEAEVAREGKDKGKEMEGAILLQL
jgi:hypothetical protein